MMQPVWRENEQTLNISSVFAMPMANDCKSAFDFEVIIIQKMVAYEFVGAMLYLLDWVSE